MPDPEAELVLQALAPAGAPAPEALDWERVWSLAARHGVLGHVALLRLPQAPAAFRARLGDWARDAAAETLRVEADLAALASALGEPAPVLLKGPAVARELYPEAPATRRYSDVDLLGTPAAVPRLDARLRALGYAPLSGLPSRLVAPYVARGDELAYVHPDRVTVDLHWRLVDPTLAGPALAAAVVGGARRRHGLPLPSSDLEATLVYLALHGCKHDWEHLVWLADVARLVVRPELDWPRVSALARAARAERALALTRGLLVRLLGVEAGPPAVTDPALDRLIATRASRPLDAPPRAEFAARLGYQLALRPRRRDRLRLLWRMVTTPSEHEWRRLALPPALFGGYAVPRVARLLRKHVGRPKGDAERVSKP